MRILKWGLVLAIPAVWVAAASAQEKVVPEGTTVKLLLLRQKSVQEELKLSPEVTKKIMDFTNQQHAAFRDAMKLDRAEREKKLDAMEEENKAFVTDTLTKQQDHRLNQITLQLTGLFQLTRPEVARALDLTENQINEFTKLQQEVRPELRELLFGQEKEGRSEKLAKHRQETRTKIMALLTPEQRKKVREMVGEPFNGRIVIEGRSGGASK
jgi:hypothetical protein